MEGKSGMVSIILFVIIGLLSVTLAAVVIGFFVLGGNNGGTPKSTVIIIDKSKQKPASTEIAKFYLYGAEESAGEAQTLSLKRGDDGASHVILMNSTIIYRTKVDGISSTAILLEEEKDLIKQTYIKYFAEMTVDEASDSKVSLDKAAKD